MKLSWQGLVVTALAAFAAGLGGVRLGMHAFQKGAPTPHDIVHQRLNLTDERASGG